VAILKGKKVVIIGDRDGIPGPAIEKCVKTAGGEVVFSSTECFVWTAAGAMDLENQRRVKECAEKYGKENVVVVLGASEGEAAGLAAETVTAGDPTFAGPLAGVSLGLSVYHICEPEMKSEIDGAVYEQQISMMEMVLNVDDIIKEMTSIREQYCNKTWKNTV
jgi:glycine reductase